MTKKFDQWVIKYEDYYTKEEGTFQPFKLIDEGKVLETKKVGVADYMAIKMGFEE